MSVLQVGRMLRRAEYAPTRASEKAAAHRLGLSHSTVKHHLANARSKVGATTTAQLVWILGPRLPRPEDERQPESRFDRSRSGLGHVAGEGPADECVGVSVPH